MKQMMPTTGRGFTGFLLCVLCVSVAGLTGCRGDREDKPPRQFLPDMDDSPKWKPQVETPFFEDGRSMRRPPEGAVAYGRFDFDIDAAGAWAEPFKRERADLLKGDDAFYRGVDASGKYLRTIPVEVTPELLARGQERFGIYCAVCHGYAGDGQGMVGQRWTGLTVADFHNAKYTDPNEPDQKSADGYIFHTALNGIKDPNTGAIKMPPYRHALTERDAWAVVAYIRVLQETVPLDQVPAEQRQTLEAERAKLPPAPQPAGAAPAAPEAPKGNP